MWKKEKTHNFGTELNQEIALGNGKVLDVSIRYRGRNRYYEGAPYMIRMDFIVSDVYPCNGYSMKRTVFDFSNMPRDVAFTGYEYEKRTIGNLNKIAAKYDTPEKVLNLFYEVNPGFKPTEVPDPLAIPVTA